MTDPSRVILESLLIALQASAKLRAAFGDQDPQVWQTPPIQGATGDPGYPFLQIGEIQIVADERVEIDEEDPDEIIVDDPSEAFVTLHAKSRPRANGAGGMPEAMAIMAAARDVISKGIALVEDDDGTSFRLVLCDFAGVRHFTDADGLTAHSVATPRFVLEPKEGP